MVSKGDFHSHSTASDGVLSPAELVKLAYKEGVRVLALTDHDSTEGIAEARCAVEAYDDFTLIPGVELGTDIPGGEVHVLGFYLEPDDATLQATLSKLREGRIGRGEGIVKKLQEMGMDVTWEQVKRFADGGAVGRPHVALALVEGGHVATVKEAFDKYIARNGPAYVEREKMTPAEAVKMILQLGGVPCIAHPGYLDDLDGVLADLKDAGLVGMEVYYKDYEPAEVERMRQAAERFDLIAWGGSDYHGLHGPDEPNPGGMYTPLPDASVDALLELGRARAVR